MHTKADVDGSDGRLAAGTATLLWHELIRDAEHRADSSLDESLESYLVFTLLRHQGDTALGQRVIATEWLAAIGRGKHLQQQNLRDVGDHCLLLAGLYPEQAERRLVSLSYFIDLGRHAYDHLAAQLKAGMAELYGQLARGFNELVRVLLEVRKLSGQWQGLAPLQNFELCQERGQLRPELAQRSFPGAIVLDGPERAQ
jgi:hypothetical protein